MSHLARQQIKELIVNQDPPLVGDTLEVPGPEFEEYLQPDTLDLRIGVVVEVNIPGKEALGEPSSAGYACRDRKCADSVPLMFMYIEVVELMVKEVERVWSTAS